MNSELRGLIVEQTIDAESNGVEDADAFAKYVFAEIEKRGKMDLNQLMKELDSIIGDYKKERKFD